MKYEGGWHLGAPSYSIIIVIIIALAFITMVVISMASIAKGFLRRGFIHPAAFTLRYMDHNKEEK